MDDIKTPPTNRGLLSFVSDQMFELDFLDKEESEMRDNNSTAISPAQVDNVEIRAHPDDDRVLLLHNRRYSRDYHFVRQGAGVRH